VPITGSAIFLPLIVKRSMRSVSTLFPFAASERTSNSHCVAGSRKPRSVAAIASRPRTGAIGMLW
jgi:hypothetical protein